MACSGLCHKFLSPPQRQSSRKLCVTLQDAEEDAGHSGAHSSAAWCLSAVLLFLSLLLLRQAFVPAGSPDGSVATAVASGGQNRHIAKGLAMPANPYLDSNTTTTVILLPLGSGLSPAPTNKEVTSLWNTTCMQNTP